MRSGVTKVILLVLKSDWGCTAARLEIDWGLQKIEWGSQKLTGVGKVARVLVNPVGVTLFTSFPLGLHPGAPPPPQCTSVHPGWSNEVGCIYGHSNNLIPCNGRSSCG